MSLSQTLIPEFEREMATTRRVLERVPTEQGEWRPHPRSFPLGHLAQLVATMPGWFTRMLRDGEIDVAAGAGYSYQTTESLLEQFDGHVREAGEAIRAASDGTFAESWSLRMGDQPLITQSRWEGVRSGLNHLVHHRGQLTVYFRLLEVPVPSIYGPTADEPWQFPGSE